MLYGLVVTTSTDANVACRIGVISPFLIAAAALGVVHLLEASDVTAYNGLAVVLVAGTVAVAGAEVCGS